MSRELFNISYEIENEGKAHCSDSFIPARFDRNLTINVSDYFGREVYNGTRVILDNNTVWNAPISVYSYKFTNNGDQYTRLWLYYSPAASPYQVYLPPHETQEFALLPGWYRFAATVYDSNGVTGLTYTWVRTVSNVGYVMLNGATITEVLVTAQGIQSQQKVITDILTPDIVWVGNNMPGVPAWIGFYQNMTVLDNRYVVQTSSHQTGSGAWMYFNTTEPSTYTTLTLLNDYFYFTGNYSTAIRINYTSNGTAVYSSNTLASSISLYGGSYTIWTNRTISATRDLSFRFSCAFSYNYYTATDNYRAQVTLNNPSATVWRDTYVFIPYQNGSYVDNRSLSVFDMNNSLYLVEGSQYVLSETGVYMWFSTFANNTYRGFQIDYTTTNDSWKPPVTQVTIVEIGDGNNMTWEWQGVPFYYANIYWTNSYRETYDNEFVIKFATNPMPDMTSIRVFTGTGAVVVDAIISGNTITIPNVRIAVGEAVHYRILFQSATGANGQAFEFGGVSVYIILAIAFVISVLVSALMIWSKETDAKKLERNDLMGKLFLAVAMLSVIAIVLLSILQTMSGLS